MKTGVPCWASRKADDFQFCRSEPTGKTFLAAMHFVLQEEMQGLQHDRAYKILRFNMQV
jgi:hypothetical protein